MPKRSYLHDDEGHSSLMRLMCLLAELVAIAITVYVFYRGDKGLFDSAFGWLITWLAAAFGGKATQKFIEVAPPQKQPKRQVEQTSKE